MESIIDQIKSNLEEICLSMKSKIKNWAKN